MNDTKSQKKVLISPKVFKSIKSDTKQTQTKNPTLSYSNNKSTIAVKQQSPYKSAKYFNKNITFSLFQKLTQDHKLIQDSENEIYISEGHKNFCKTRDTSHLTQPIVMQSTTALIPFKTLIYTNYRSLDDKVAFRPFQLSSEETYELKSYLEYNNYNTEFLNRNSLLNNLTYDTNWIAEQMQYIYSLSKYDIFTLKGYTIVGDILINNRLRKTLNKTHLGLADYFVNGSGYFPLFFQIDKYLTNVIEQYQETDYKNIFEASQKTYSIAISKKLSSQHLPKSLTIKEWWKYVSKNYKTLKNSEKYILIVNFWKYFKQDIIETVIDMFGSDIERIIKSAPHVKRDMVVYRGVTSDFYLTGAQNGIYKNIGFVSTSLDIDVAKNFQQFNENNRHDKNCCLKRILILKGTKAINLMPVSEIPSEKEILLNSGTVYFIKRQKALKVFYKNPEDSLTRICYDKTYKVNVSDIVITN